MDQYRKCRKAIERFLGSGRMGAIGHVSCIDRLELAEIPAEAVMPGAIAGTLAARLEAVCELLGWKPTSVITRVSRGAKGPAVQLFLQAGDEHTIHYLATFDGAPVGHELWIEGAGGSVRTDGNAVWWRKRGWPKFIPTRLGLFGSTDQSLEEGPGGDLSKAIAESAQSGESVALAQR